MQKVLTSLVITTYNRAALLGAALESVAKSRIDDRESVEVIVVDNNSTDQTHQTVEDVRTRDFPFILRYVLEQRQGLSYARNRATEEAAGTYIAFMDDDQLIEEHYLSRIEPAFRNTRAACVGGPVLYHKAGSLPDWLAPLLEGIEQRVQGDETKILGPRDGKLTGGNMVFDRRDLITAGKFDVNLGRCGDSLLAGEEDEMQQRLHAAGKIVAYCPQLIQYHYLAPARLTKRYWRRHHFDYGRTLYRMNMAKADADRNQPFLGAPRWLWGRLLTEDIPRAARSLMSFDMACRFHRQLDVCARLGQIYEARHASRAKSKA